MELKDLKGIIRLGLCEVVDNFVTLWRFEDNKINEYETGINPAVAFEKYGDKEVLRIQSINDTFVIQTN